MSLTKKEKAIVLKAIDRIDKAIWLSPYSCSVLLHEGASFELVNKYRSLFSAKTNSITCWHPLDTAISEKEKAKIRSTMLSLFLITGGKL